MPLHRVTKIFTPSTIQYEWLVDEMYCQFLRKMDHIKLFYKIGHIDHHFRFTHEDWEIAGKKLVHTIKNNPSIACQAKVCLKNIYPSIAIVKIPSPLHVA